MVLKLLKKKKLLRQMKTCWLWIKKLFKLKRWRKKEMKSMKRKEMRRRKKRKKRNN